MTARQSFKKFIKTHLCLAKARITEGRLLCAHVSRLHTMDAMLQSYMAYSLATPTNTLRVCLLAFKLRSPE